MSDFSTNLRFLLWKKGIPRNCWLKEIALWFNSDLKRAKEILGNEKISSQESKNFQKNFDATEEEFMEILNGDLITINKIWIFKENFFYLLDSSYIDGQKKRGILKKVDINPATVNRWENGLINNPNSVTLKKIYDFFGISQNIDITLEPIFLNLEPIGIFLQRQWLCERINQINGKELEQLYPALRRIFDVYYDN